MSLSFYKAVCKNINQIFLKTLFNKDKDNKYKIILYQTNFKMLTHLTNQILLTITLKIKINKFKMKIQFKDNN